MELAWIPALQNDTRTRNVHASTAIEDNPLTLQQVRALEEGRDLSASGARAKREVLNYFAGLRFVEKHATKKRIGHEEILNLHRVLAGEVMVPRRGGVLSHQTRTPALQNHPLHIGGVGLTGSCLLGSPPRPRSDGLLHR